MPPMTSPPPAAVECANILAAGATRPGAAALLIYCASSAAFIFTASRATF